MNVKEFSDKIKEALPGVAVASQLTYDGNEQKLVTQVTFQLQASFTLTGDDVKDMQVAQDVIDSFHNETMKLLPTLDELEAPKKGKKK